MKLNSNTPFFTAIAMSFLLTLGCDQPPKGDSAVITDEQETSDTRGQVYTVDTSESKIRFIGYGVGKKHPGNFHISTGMVSVMNNQLTGGEFTIDVKKMKVEEEGDVYQNKLRPHLLSGDFFDAENFETATFEITNVEPYKMNSSDTSIIEGANFNVSGNLTIKDETKNVTFPARIELDDNTLKGKADFDIDRTQWKMNYGNDKTLGDKFISEVVNIELDLKAVRQSDETLSSR